MSHLFALTAAMGAAAGEVVPPVPPIPGAWDLETFVYDSSSNVPGSFSFAGQGVGRPSVFFKPDGTKMYIAEYGTDSMFQYTLSSPWDIRTATYDSVSFNMTAQDANLHEIFFKPDGTKFYMSGETNDKIFQYTCSTPWNIATASYDSVFFSYTGQVSAGGGCPGMSFKPDGTKMYLVGSGTAQSIFQYTLSTPWNVSTATYDSVSFNHGFHNGNIFFKDDGTKFYMVGENIDKLQQYNCGTPWNISTASFEKQIEIVPFDGASSTVFVKPNGLVFYIAGYGNDSVWQLPSSSAWDVGDIDIRTLYAGNSDSTPTDIYFKPDGTKMYVIGLQSDTVYQFSLPTPWKIASAIDDGVSFSIGGQEINPYGMTFKPDGTKFYIVGSGSDSVHQYTLSTPWNLATASYDSISKNILAQDTSMAGIEFKPDGTKMYLCGFSNDDVFQYTLSTPWNVSTATYDSVFLNVAPQEAFPIGLTFKSDGTKMYLCGTQGDDINQYTLSTPWNLATATFDSVTLSIADRSTDPYGLKFKPDGTKLFVATNTPDYILEYDVPTAWDISSVATGEFGVATWSSDTEAVHISPDGTRMYVLDNAGDQLEQFDLLTPWQINTAGHTNSFSVAGQDTQMHGVFFKPDGTKFYTVGAVSGNAFQYTCSTPWNISTASYDSVSFALGATPQDIWIKSDGTKFYVISASTDTVRQYTMATPWNLATASYDSVDISIAAQEITAQALFFRSNGERMYIGGDTAPHTIFQYNLSSAYDVSTAVYSGVSLNVNDHVVSAVQGMFFKPDGTKMYLADEANAIYQYRSE